VHLGDVIGCNNNCANDKKLLKFAKKLVQTLQTFAIYRIYFYFILHEQTALYAILFARGDADIPGGLHATSIFSFF